MLTGRGQLPPPPAVPPRTYPQLPPSNIPNILIGILRITMWGAGVSAMLVFVYHVCFPVTMVEAKGADEQHPAVPITPPYSFGKRAQVVEDTPTGPSHEAHVLFTRLQRKAARIFWRSSRPFGVG